jgi:hypothetical protein
MTEKTQTAAVERTDTTVSDIGSSTCTVPAIQQNRQGSPECKVAIKPATLRKQKWRSKKRDEEKRLRRINCLKRQIKRLDHLIRGGDLNYLDSGVQLSVRETNNFLKKGMTNGIGEMIDLKMEEIRTLQVSCNLTRVCRSKRSCNRTDPTVSAFGSSSRFKLEDIVTKPGVVNVSLWRFFFSRKK